MSADQILGHGDECDGIEEYDNKLPAWWLGLFYFGIIFGIGYTVHYHMIADRSQAGEYDAEVAAAAVTWPAPSAEELLAATPEDIEKGAEIYASTCVGCHGADLTGGIGPNLTDAEWIHGSSLEDINKTVTDGVPDKGMLAWGPILGPQKVAQVSAFIHSKAQGN